MTGEQDAGPNASADTESEARNIFTRLGARQARFRDHPSPIYAWLAVLLGTVLLPIILCSSIAAYAAYREALTQEMRTIARLGASVTSRETHLIESTRRLLDVFAEIQSLPPTAASEPRCSTSLANIVASFTEYSVLSVVDDTGIVACSATAEALGVSVADSPWFQRIRQTGKIAVSSIVKSKLTSEPIVVVGLPLPTEQGHFRGTISVEIKLLWLSDLAKGLVLPTQASVFLLDRDGTVATQQGKVIDARDPKAPALAEAGPPAAFPDYSFLMSSEERDFIQFQANGHDGIARLDGVATLPNTNLYVLYGIPRSKLLGWGREGLLWGC
jgi:hypothetical protein